MTGHHSEYLSSEKIKPIFMYRDPRAILASNFFYVRDLKRHHLHTYFNRLPNDEERYRVLILRRTQEPEVYSIRDRLLKFHGWVNDPNVLTVKFEDLVGARGGGTPERRALALSKLVACLDMPHVDVEKLVHAETKATPTMREGKIDSWRKSIPESMLTLIYEQCGDLMLDLGYDID